MWTRTYFNPRSPRWGATICRYYTTGKLLNISIHAPHDGERHKVQRPPRRGRAISIHAPHDGERPLRLSMRIAASTYFNPRSPRWGATRSSARPSKSAALFQSTLPTMGSDIAHYGVDKYGDIISIHAPHDGERPRSQCMIRPLQSFQSTLPTMGSDYSCSAAATSYRVFQSTLPTMGSDAAKE